MEHLIFRWLTENLQYLNRLIRMARNNNGNILIDKELPEILAEKIVNIRLSFNCDLKRIDLFAVNFEIGTNHLYSIGNIQFKFYFYQLYEDTSTNHLEDDLPCTFHTCLPSKDFNGLWESLVFDINLQYKLLSYIRTSMIFGKKQIDSTLINWNKVLLLHGPPGTGKTSLCKALAQKLSIIFFQQYACFQLIEINAHSLFSKWFSESGKLVLKLFDSIRDFAEDKSNMIFVLIDEVESLVYDRQRTNSSDPSDAVRVVNALLTQIDSIKRYPNIMILANSNVTNAMDNAFIDRVDIKQFIGYPSIATIYQIYASCILELIKCEMIFNFEKDDRLYQQRSQQSKEDEDSEEEIFLPYDDLIEAIQNDATNDYHDVESLENSRRLLEISKMSENFAGRTLRKLPFLAIALNSNEIDPYITLTQFLHSLERVVIERIQDNEYFNRDANR